LEFKKTYPDDAIVVELNHFLENYNDVLEVINQQFAINLSKIDVSDLYEPSLLANKKKKESRLRLFSHTKLQSTMKALKEQSLWI